MSSEMAWPPGFRFHPTDEELLLYYLKGKICGRNFKVDVIPVVDVYKKEPEELSGLSILKTGDRQWFFFCPMDRNYAKGSRLKRGTRHGFWRPTGEIRNINSNTNSRIVGIKKTLIFYQGRPHPGERTNWTMHEYILEEDELKRSGDVQNYYILYKLFKKSGAGAKNGEHYGAPFREEDWADKELIESMSELTESMEDEYKEKPQAQSTSSDEELMKMLSDELALEEPHIPDFQFAVPHAFGEGAQSTLVDTHFDLHNMELSSPSQAHLHDGYEHIIGEDFIGVDDLPDIDIMHNAGGAKQHGGSLQWADIYRDPKIFFSELGPVNDQHELQCWEPSLGMNNAATRETCSFFSFTGSSMLSNNCIDAIDDNLWFQN